jgi:hypothetical protein
MTFLKAYQNFYDNFTQTRRLDDNDSSWTEAQRQEFKAAYRELEIQYGVNVTEKAIRSDIKLEPSKGVPGPLEVERALSRLAILPNPNVITIDEPEKFVESPWETVPVFTFDPNLYDEANLTVVNLNELFGTDPYLSRKKVKQHIESLGQALTPYRHYALVVVKNGQKTILDGHHRLMAQWLLGQPTAPVWLVEEK